MIEMAIVGLGSWGLCVLERTVSRARQVGTPVRLHLVEPAQLGGGVYSAEQPDFLVLNNACGQLSLYAAPDGDTPPPYAVGLHQWAMVRGYRWVGYECRIGAGGEPIRPTDYLPRRLMGEYLAWFYDTLVDYAPPNLEIVRHYAAAVDISPALAGREAVLLDNGTTLTVDHVVLTSGHTWNHERGVDGGVRYLRPYPIECLDQSAPAGSSVAVAGMGLVGFDVLTALTIGRGGTFEDRCDRADRLRYVPSGREPTITLYSRSGTPYCAKSATGVDPYGQYQPVVCTPEEFAALTNPGGSPVRRHVDFRAELLPLIFAEMQARYYIQAALLSGGDVESTEVRAVLRQGWVDGHYEKVVDALEPQLRALRPGHPPLRRVGPPLHVGRRLPGPGLRHDRGRPHRGPATRGEPGQGGPGGAAHPPGPAAFGHRVRWSVARLLRRVPVQRPRPHQPAGGGRTTHALPAVAGAARRRSGAHPART